MTFSMMYSPDKMMSGKSPLPMSTPGSCFPSRYSPTYRTPTDSMRRCITNPPSRILEDSGIMCNSWSSSRHNVSS
ncbi:inhibitory POU protein-like [Diaphorina citri]|uniref:Inhibitory POU protein-like n=1 Tax=Diaphorina citri TaxID=121845 RepID=A0A3Q0J8Z2_DIACI|nr:inhibitory POU protein-like [Diaphorina citri]